ncbi:MAG: RICIN domain-containing protein, partial [Oscillospiraceae bacterium]|nr:RICIN domain-containing protein [Oscillospiraceae bacterium]
IDVMDGKSGAVFDTAYTYMFRNEGSGLYLEVADSKAENGANVQEGTTGAKNWTLLDAGNGYYKICSEVGDGKSFLLDLDSGNPDNGTNIGIWGDTESDAQSFKFAANGDGTYAIVTKATRDKSGVGIDGGSTAEGANVIQWSLDGPDNQKWIPEIQLNTGGRLITNLRVTDMTCVSGWKFDDSIAVNDLVFGDRDAYYTDIPEALTGAEAILTACDSKFSTGSLAVFEAGADMTVYAAFDNRVANLPEWLSDYTLTEMTAVNSKNVTFDLYAKEVKAGETVILGDNGQSSTCVNYTVFAVEAQNEPEPEKIEGDVNTDGETSVLDIVMLQKYLLKVGSLSDSAAADMNADGIINVFDLCIMKHKLLEKV